MKIGHNKMSRYSRTGIVVNNTPEYTNFLRSRKLYFIEQYKIFDFKNLKNFKDYNLDVVVHTVKPYEKLYNISYEYYKSSEYSWVICYTNSIASELDIETGMKLNIYMPLNNLLELL